MILRCDHIVWDQIYFIKTFSIFEYSTSHNNGKIFNSRWLLLTFLNDKIMLVTNGNILRIAHQNKNRFFPLFSNKYPSFIRVTWNLKECCNNNVHRIRIHIQTTAIAYMLIETSCQNVIKLYRVKLHWIWILIWFHFQSTLIIESMNDLPLGKAVQWTVQFKLALYSIFTIVDWIELNSYKRVLYKLWKTLRHELMFLDSFVAILLLIE